MALTKTHNRMIEGSAVNVKDLGAVGNGTTDDTIAIQAALDLGPNKSIYFPSGTYLVSNLTSGPNLFIYGDGATNSTIKFKDGSSGNLFSSTNATHLSIRDLRFDGNQTNCPSGAHCISISGSESGGSGFFIDNCKIVNAKSIGIYQTGTYTDARISRCIVSGCQLDGIAISSLSTIIESNHCSDNGRFGILSQGNYTQIIGNTCNSNGQVVTGGAGIGVVTGDYAIVSGNTCLSNGTGSFFAHGIQFNGVTNGVMEGNFSQGNNGSGLDMYQSTYTTCTGNQSVSNKVRGIENDTTSTYSIIDGNIVQSNEEIGISVFNTIGSVVSNNSVIANGTLGTATNTLTGVANQPYGIALWGAGNYGNFTTISSNAIVQNVGSGSNGVGVYVDTNSSNVALTDNSFSANTSNITASSYSFHAVRDNLGIATQQSGSSVIASGTTSIAVTLSPAFAFTPVAANISLTPTNSPTNDFGFLYVTSVSSSGFTINVRNNPGSGGLGVSWSIKQFA